MAFRKKYKSIEKFDADILILQECESEDTMQSKGFSYGYDQIIWYGKNKNKGISIMSRNGYKISLLQHNKEFQYIVPVSISKGEVNYTLLAVWTQLVNKSIFDSYIVQATRAFHWYERLLDGENVIVAGDFNSNTRRDGGDPKEYTHSDMVTLLTSKGMSSIYHKWANKQQGKEEQPTLFLQKNLQRPYHIDYIFVKEKMMSQIKSFEIGNFDSFIEQSDHMPFFLDLG